MYTMKCTMLKLSRMYKVWNGLALPHLKVRLTIDRYEMVQLRIQSTYILVGFSTDQCFMLNSGSKFGF